MVNGFDRIRRVGLIAVVMTAGMVPMRAKADDVPWVSVHVAEPGHEVGLTGPCYEEDLVLEQPLGFVVTRTGSTSADLAVSLEMEGGPQHVDYIVPPEEVVAVIPRGASEVFVTRLDRVREPTISDAAWSAALIASSTGSYELAEPTEASFSGHLGSNDSLYGTPCPISDRSETVTLHVGEEWPGYLWFSRTRVFTLEAGALPPGVTLDPHHGPVGAAQEVGEFPAKVRECPYPSIGKPICGTISYLVRVLESPPACPADRVPPFPFWDVDAESVHRHSVACVAWWGIALGDGSYGFNPDGSVTRGQLASFLARTVELARPLPSGILDAFSDDAGTTHEDNINRMAAIGVLRGDASGGSSEAAAVTRAQAASMVVRAIEWATEAPVPSGADRFQDDSGSTHEASINALAAAAIVSGTSATTFGPERHLSRAQMATMLTGVLNRLTLSGLPISSPSRTSRRAPR